jgi:hypothetical protein
MLACSQFFADKQQEIVACYHLALSCDVTKSDYS